MNVVVIGHLVLDEIHAADGTVRESFGGIWFPLSAFSSLARERDRIIPVFPVGADAWDAFRSACAAFPRTDPSACARDARPGTRVRLFHDAQAQYNTQLVRSLDPIPFASVAPALADADLVYINFMTGEDLTLEDAGRLRGATPALIYLDMHMIAYRVGADGHRAVARVAEWTRWANVPDVLQCNERELGVLVDPEMRESDVIAAVFRASRLRQIVLTRGAAGASVFDRSGGRIDVPAHTLPALADTTGCGDVFGSTYAFSIAAGYPPADAGARAAAAGAFTAGIPGSIGMERLRAAVEAVPCA